MPLTRCPDCNRDVSDAAPACVHCGRPMHGRGVSLAKPRPGKECPACQRPNPVLADFCTRCRANLADVEVRLLQFPEIPLQAPSSAGSNDPPSMDTFFKIGVTVLAAGLIALFLSMGMDTTVEVGGEFIFDTYVPSSRVNNLGLMSQKQTYVVASGVTVVVGIVLIAVGALRQRSGG